MIEDVKKGYIRREKFVAFMNSLFLPYELVIKIATKGDFNPSMPIFVKEKINTPQGRFEGNLGLTYIIKHLYFPVPLYIEIRLNPYNYLRMLNKDYRTVDAREDVKRYFGGGYYLHITSHDEYKTFNNYSLISIKDLASNKQVSFRYGSKKNKGKVDITGYFPALIPIRTGKRGFGLGGYLPLAQELYNLILSNNRGVI